MNWYDTFAHFYDLSVERINHPVRQSAFELLQRGLGPVVIDLACGTGQNFPHLIERLGGETVQLIGVDYSPGMLAKAKQRVAKRGWQNVRLIETDARALTKDEVEEALGRQVAVDYIVCAFALSAIPDWEGVFEQLFGLLRPGGQFLILGAWSEHRVPQSYWVELIARADLKRKTWEPLEQVSEGYVFRFLEGSPHVHGGRLFVASGFKPG